MACGCGKKVARPSGATPTVSIQTRQSTTARVVAASSPYSSQQNVAPAHLQPLLRKTV